MTERRYVSVWSAIRLRTRRTNAIFGTRSGGSMGHPSAVRSSRSNCRSISSIRSAEAWMTVEGSPGIVRLSRYSLLTCSKTRRCSARSPTTSMLRRTRKKVFQYGRPIIAAQVRRLELEPGPVFNVTSKRRHARCLHKGRVKTIALPGDHAAPRGPERWLPRKCTVDQLDVHGALSALLV